MQAECFYDSEWCRVGISKMLMNTKYEEKKHDRIDKDDDEWVRK